ncbi:hypothetical protein ACFXAF_06295 [Kitasatospora sp. NPDC059463]|uniref:hypothetical protein n=1 Tax=unclassified Kitasatospora TaxID=2633591 RepID=UPI0036BC7C8A
MRRTTVPVLAATAAVLALLTGCEGDDGSAAAGAFDPAEAVAKGAGEPYAVTVKATHAGDSSTITARFNLNTVYTGRWEFKDEDGNLRETVTTADAEYLRGHDATGTWLKTPRTVEVSDLDYGGYAGLLLAQGASARKGMETTDGVPTYHLAGHLGVEQLAGPLPAAHRMLTSAGVTGIDLDQWIDAQGRTRHVEQAMVVEGRKDVLTLVFGDFGPAETFTAPGPVAG